MIFVSRILGFIRDLIVAQVFGTTASVDAFYIAFRIPNFMRNLFAEGSLSNAFVPTLKHYQHHVDPKQTQLFVQNMFGILGSILLIVTGLGMLCAPILTHIFAPGLESDRFELTTVMLRIIFPYLMLISLTALSSAILNSHEIFWVPAFTPALLNVCLIATAFGTTTYFSVPIEAQAWGVFAAGFVQLIFQFPFLKRLGFLHVPKFNWRDPGVQKVLILMLPAVFGASVSQLSLLLNTLMASFLKVGSVSWLYYSERLVYFPLGVFSVATATVLLTHLARHHILGTTQPFSHTLHWGLRCNLLICIPAALTLLLLAGPLTISLFYYGHFNEHDVYMTQECVRMYALGLPALMLIKVLNVGFYARNDLKTPIRFTAYAIALNLIMSLILIYPLQHVGLALASSFAAWMNAILLGVTLKRRKILLRQMGWVRFILQLLLASCALIVLYYFSWSLNQWLHWSWQQRVMHLTYLAFSAVVLYLGVLWASGMRMRHFKLQC